MEFFMRKDQCSNRQLSKLASVFHQQRIHFWKNCVAVFSPGQGVHTDWNMIHWVNFFMIITAQGLDDKRDWFILTKKVKNRKLPSGVICAHKTSVTKTIEGGGCNKDETRFLIHTTLAHLQSLLSFSFVFYISIIIASSQIKPNNPCWLSCI